MGGVPFNKFGFGIEALEDGSMFKNVNGTLLARRLSQLINTDLLVSQMDSLVIGGNVNRKNVTKPTEYTSLV